MAKFTPKVVSTIIVAPNKCQVGKFVGRSAPVQGDDVVVLADSLRTRGQEQPIKVRPIPGTDEFDVIFGNTRKAAADMIVAGYTDSNGKEVKAQPDFRLRAEVVECTDEEAHISNMIENEIRNEVTPIDRATNYQKCRDEYDMTDAAIARMFGRDPGEISRLKKIMEVLPQWMIDLVHRKKITLFGAALFAGAKDVAEADAWEALWAHCTEADDDEGTVGTTEAGKMLKAWRTEQKAAAGAADEGTSADGETSTGDEETGSGETGNGETTEPTQVIAKSAKDFKATFRALAEADDCPPNTRKLAALVLDYYGGKIEASNGKTDDQVFVHRLMAMLGEKPVKAKPVETPAMETPAPDAEEPPADGLTQDGKQTKTQKRKAKASK